MKFDRQSKEYLLAEKIVHLEDALNRANNILASQGKLGVLPNQNVSFNESKTFHKKVRNKLNII